MNGEYKQSLDLDWEDFILKELEGFEDKLRKTVYKSSNVYSIFVICFINQLYSKGYRILKKEQ